MAPRTVGNYFPQKIDLLVSYRESMLAAAEQAVALNAGRPPLERVREALVAAARENELHPNGRLAQALIAEHASYRALAAVQERFSALLGDLLVPGGLRPEADRDVAVLALVAGYVALQREWARGRRASLVAGVEHLFAQWASGVAAGDR